MLTPSSVHVTYGKDTLSEFATIITFKPSCKPVGLKTTKYCFFHEAIEQFTIVASDFEPVPDGSVLQPVNTYRKPEEAITIDSANKARELLLTSYKGFEHN